MKLEKVTILRLSCTDLLVFSTDLPQGLWPFKDTGATLKMEVVRGDGPSYVKKHFPGVEYEIISKKGKEENLK